MQPSQHQQHPQQRQQLSIVLSCSSSRSACFFCSLRRVALFYGTLRLVIAIAAIVALQLHYFYWIPAKQRTSQAVAVTAAGGNCWVGRGMAGQRQRGAVAAEVPLRYVP